jgi:PAS domain S-box-containing protein
MDKNSKLYRLKRDKWYFIVFSLFLLLIFFYHQFSTQINPVLNFKIFDTISIFDGLIFTIFISITIVSSWYFGGHRAFMFTSMSWNIEIFLFTIYTGRPELLTELINLIFVFILYFRESPIDKRLRLYQESLMCGISDREKKLRENEIKFIELADRLPQGIFETDEQGNIIYVNEAWLEICGYNHDDFFDGLNISDILDSNSFMTMLKSHDTLQEEFIVTKKDKTTFSALIFSNMIENSVMRISRGILIDNTARKKYVEELKREKDKAMESDRLKSAFLANMSHEFRTPLTAILGFSELLLRDKKLPQKKSEEFINHIKENGHHLLNLINDVIDIAKIEANQFNIYEESFALKEFMDKIFITYKKILIQKYKKHHIRFFLETDENDVELYTDQLRLRQVIINLLNNAFKFTNEGHVTFGYKFVNGDTIEIFVEDTGIGIKDDKQAVIFERFRQADELSLTQKSAGTGLGLSISQKLVELIGGDKINVYSVYGEGSRFYFKFLVKQNSIKETSEKSVFYTSNG